MDSSTLDDDVQQLLSGAGTAEAKARVFRDIKPICTQLLFQRRNPQQLTQLLDQLTEAVRNADPLGLKACYDYAVYPLLFMMESAAASRAPANSPSNSGTSCLQPSSQTSSSIGRMAVTIPAMRNDRAAEAVLGCAVALLQRVCGLEQDQIIAVLQPIATLLTLPAGSTTEEMRLQALRLVPAALSSQQQRKQQRQHLNDPHLVPLAGVLISSCLSAADVEVAAAGTGSKAVRHAAVQALQSVVRSVGPGGQLAYFLPGLASGLMKQILAAVPPSAGVHVSGAAASSSTTVLLVQVMTEAIILTLGDAAIRHIPDSSSSSSQQQQQQLDALGSSSNVINADDAMAMLRQLSLQASDTSTTVSVAELGVLTSNGSSSSSGSTDQKQQQRSASSSGTKPGDMSFAVEQDAAWLEASSSKVQTILAVTLPRLLRHPQPAVRKAVAAAAADLAVHACRALANSRQALLEVLLDLATDDYQQVADVAIASLQHESAAAVTSSDTRTSSSSGQGTDAGSATAAAGSTSSTSMVNELLVGLCTGLPSSVKQGEAQGIAAAKRTAAAILCASLPAVHSTVFSKPAVLPQACHALVDTFQLEPNSAALLLRAQAGFTAGEVTAAPKPTTGSTGRSSTTGSTVSSTTDSTAAQAAGVTSTGSTTVLAAAGSAAPGTAGGTTADDTASSSSTSTAAAAAAKLKAGVGHLLLPRMPLSLRHLISVDSYKAAAGVVRALGRAARLADLQLLGRSSTLKLIADELLKQLAAASSPHKQQQQTFYASAGMPATAAAAATPAAGEWQCQSAAVVVVLTELLFGASAAWHAPISSKVSSSSSSGSHVQQQQQQGDQVPWMDKMYESVLLQVLGAVTQQKLWGLPTSQTAVADSIVAAAAAVGEPGSRHRLPAQVLGANALLLRCLIDCVGAVARCSGRQFASNTQLLRTALLPLLDLLADPCPLVAAAASTALASICRHSGYPLGLGQLIGANADYVVDGVCKRLRGLQQNPRAPQMLAVLLKEAGVGAQLLPLLAEPLRAALSGLSILARKQQPGYILPFLHVLQSVAAGATAEAAASQAVFKAQAQDCIAAAAAAGLFVEQHDFEQSGDSSEESTAETTVGLEQQGAEALLAAASAGPATAGATAAAAGDTAAAMYFKRRLQRKAPEADHIAAAAGGDSSSRQSKQQQQQQQQESTVPATAEAMAAAAITLDSIPPLPEGDKLHLPLAQLEQLELTWRRAYSAASLASSAVDAATPLLLQRNLRSAVLAASVLSAALEALAVATDALDTEERLFEQLVDRGADAALRPVRPMSAKLLPAVHTVWAPLLAALQDTGSVALLEQGLGLLSKMIKLAGGKFMARRFKQEAWPLLQRLLKQGPQSGATALAAAAASSTTGGGTAAAALLGIGGGPGSETPSSSSIRGGVQVGVGEQQSSGIMQSALRSLEAANSRSSSWNEAQHGWVVTLNGHLQENQGPLAPATVQRVQVAVLACLQGICCDSSAAPAVQGPLVWDVCVLAVPYLADSRPLAMREAAAKLLVAAAQVDADAVWLVLADLGSCYQDLAQLVASAAGAVGSSTASSVAEVSSTSNNAVAHFTAAVMASVEAAGRGSSSITGALHALPKLQQLLLGCNASAAAAMGEDTTGLQRLLRSGEGVSCGKRAAALLPRVAQMGVTWHAQAEQQLAQLRSARVL